MIALALATAALPAAAEPAGMPPWRDPLDLPLPEGVASVVVGRRDLAIFTAPGASTRRGSALDGARLPIFAAKRAAGCTGRWISVGPLAWICQDQLVLSAEPPIDPGDAWGLGAPNGFPFRYYFVRGDGTQGYKSVRDADEGTPDAELQPGFAVAIVEDQAKDAQHYGRTHHGLWVPMRDLAPVRPTAFHGDDLADGKLGFAWVVEERAAIHSKPAASARSKESRPRFAKVPVLETVKGFVRIADGAWLRRADLREPTLAAPPEGTLPGERWIDVELATQTLVAYEGERPVFATLVSTGKGPEGSELATPKGVHRIWVKLETSNMDNLEDEDAERYYAIEDVPYVQFFAKGVGLHGAFWHQGFGHVRSHGCVNLAPLDAQRLFAFTAPHLPAGWTAVLPTAYERGTIVRVR